ncbi:hypothetical protein FRB96_007577 [Tulasnella sp. 330]|nr:hypothetical protein FRB96_007577 [Tulasnella sp. 330]
MRALVRCLPRLRLMQMVWQGRRSAFPEIFGAEDSTIPPTIPTVAQVKPEKPAPHLAKGGSANVWAVEEKATNLIFARKVINAGLSHAGLKEPDPKRIQAKREATNREAEIWRKLHHPHIVALRAYLKKGDDISYFIMPIARLSSLGNPYTEITFEQALLWLAQIMDATIYMHDLNITHRDLKPDNILITLDGAMVADFGISEYGPSHQSKSGTREFMAPEVANQLDGEFHNEKVDSYGIGLIF